MRAREHMSWVLVVVAYLVASQALVASAGTGSRDAGGRDAGGGHLERAGRDHHTPAVGPPSTVVAENFRVLGQSNLGGGSAHGDVYFFDHGGSAGKHAYVGTWSVPCSATGAKIVDVNDPARPRLVAYVGGRPGVSNEDLVVVRIGGRDILGIGVQPCSDQGGSGGLALFDVTDPARPGALSFTEFPDGVHELDMVVRDDGRALALLAVPFTEFSDTYYGTDLGGEFKVVDITDPARPRLLADWGYIADSDIEIVAGNDPVSSSFQGIGDYAAHYAHSARAADDGDSAYVSYWDGGILKFDLTNPSDPVLVSRTTYPVDADGDGHSVTLFESGGTRFILQNDEDIAAWSPPVVTSNVTGDRRYAGIEEPWMPTLLTERGPVTAPLHDAADGCQDADFVGATGKITLVDTVDPFYVGILDGWAQPCTLGSQVLRAARAGATAMLSSLISPDDAYPFLRSGSRIRQQIEREAGELVVVQVSDIDELAQQFRAAAEPVNVTLTPTEPSHGYLRVFREDAGTDTDGDGVVELEQVGAFRNAPHVHGSLTVPAGTWSIHNTEVHGDRAYASWFSNGVVALDLSDPTAPQMVGQFVPPTNRRYANGLGTGPAEVWGVAVDRATGVVYASDMRTGLWILQPQGPARPGNS